MNRTIHLNSPCFVWAATTPSWLGRLASYWLMAMTERSGGALRPPYVPSRILGVIGTFVYFCGGDIFLRNVAEE